MVKGLALAKPVKGKTRKTVGRGPCECGCGKAVRNPSAHFLPGHDARLKGQLARTAREGTQRQAAKAISELKQRDWLRLVRVEE